jgi:hypothetical protein
MEKRNDAVLEKISPERRALVKKLIHASYIVPAVISVSMVEQKLDLSTAHAQSSNFT